MLCCATEDEECCRPRPRARKPPPPPMKSEDAKEVERKAKEAEQLASQKSKLKKRSKSEQQLITASEILPPQSDLNVVTPDHKQQGPSVEREFFASKSPASDEASSFDDAAALKKSERVVDHIHVSASVSDESVDGPRRQLKASLEGDVLAAKHANYAFDDSVLRRFLTARENDVVKARKLLTQALDWRETRKPYVHDYEELEREARTGKVRVAEETDKWGRSVVVFDNTVQNTKDPEANMRFLAFCLEHALRKMDLKGKGAEKYVVFMQLEHFSLLNNPSWKVTKETCLMLMACFAECCGNIIVYGAPRVFYGVYVTCKPFIDPVTSRKILFCGPNNAETLLQDVVGPHWRTLMGASMPKETSKSSPGYVHARNWTQTLKDELAWRKKTGNQGALKHELKNWPGPDDNTLDLDFHTGHVPVVSSSSSESTSRYSSPLLSSASASSKLSYQQKKPMRSSNSRSSMSALASMTTLNNNQSYSRASMSALPSSGGYSPVGRASSGRNSNAGAPSMDQASMDGSSYSNAGSLTSRYTGATLAFPREDSKEDEDSKESISRDSSFFSLAALKTSKSKKSTEDKLRESISAVSDLLNDDSQDYYPEDAYDLLDDEPALSSKQKKRRSLFMVLFPFVVTLLFFAVCSSSLYPLTALNDRELRALKDNKDFATTINDTGGLDNMQATMQDALSLSGDLLHAFVEKTQAPTDNSALL